MVRVLKVMYPTKSVQFLVGWPIVCLEEHHILFVGIHIIDYAIEGGGIGLNDELTLNNWCGKVLSSSAGNDTFYALVINP